jgi:hypothetical protein
VSAPFMVGMTDVVRLIGLLPRLESLPISVGSVPSPPVKAMLKNSTQFIFNHRA